MRATDQQQPAATASGGIAYLPGLDGLRALAVLAVLLFHADLPPHGGFLGVESFFVISGFLITALLLADWETHGRIRLKTFWWRRARRLLPALFALLAGVTLLTALLLPRELGLLGGEIAAALAYVTNWQLIAGGQPYFDAVQRPPLLQHLWSLAVEEQFYVVWPLLVGLGLRFAGRRGLLALTLLGAAGSLALMAALFEPGADPSRLYYGTDTRASGLLLGAALAFVWDPGRAPALSRPWAGRALDGVGLAALAALLASYALIGEGHPLLYRGGFALVALLTALLLATATHPAARLLPRLLELPALRWVGLRSYSLYLWHWPIFMLLRPGVDLALSEPLVQLLRFGLAFGLAALSYRFIELPIRHGALERAWARLEQRAAPAGRRPPWRQPLATMGAAVAMCLTVSCAGTTAVRGDFAQVEAAPAQSLAPALPQGAPERAPTAAAPGTAAGGAATGGTARAPNTAAAPASAPAPSRQQRQPALAPAEAAPSVDPALAAELQALLDGAVADGFVPGAVLSVRLSDGSVWSGASGVADRDAAEAMSTGTAVRIGSLSKLFTAVAVLQLAEEGAIGLDEPVATYLPDLLPDGQRITVRMLLQHTAGLYDYLEDQRFFAEAYRLPEQQWAPADLVAYANEFPRSFAPGAAGAWDYSNTNFVVLGMLVEQVAGRSLADELERRIFAPLGLEQTSLGAPDARDLPQAQGYTRSEVNRGVNLSFGFGTASVVTTADDLRRFGAALFGGELLSADSMAQMQRFVGGKGQYDMPELQYGLGLMANRLSLGEDLASEQGRVLGHIGGINGFRAALWYQPERDILIALSTNQSAIDPNTLSAQILDRLLRAQGE